MAWRTQVINQLHRLQRTSVTTVEWMGAQTRMNKTVQTRLDLLDERVKLLETLKAG